MSTADVIIIGSGMGGATVAAALADTGKRIVIVERGERLSPSPADRDPQLIFGKGHFRPRESWQDAQGHRFNPGNYYYVGGNSKFFGAVLMRYRRQDFAPLRHMGGTTPGWPFGYDELEPYYQQAEQLYQVRGIVGEDPTEPVHSGRYTFPPVPDEPPVADLRRRLQSVGLHPASIPLGVDIERWLLGGQTTWDAYPNTSGGKMDAESVGLATALTHPNVTLRTGTRATRLVADGSGRISAVEVETAGARETLSAPTVILAAGAVQTAALLLTSGLANSSDQVGRNFMNHNTTAVLAMHPFRINSAVYQKTILANDFYLTGGPRGEPLGNIQMLGKITAPILKANVKLPLAVVRWIAEHSFDILAMSEDLPNPESRVTLRNGDIVLDWKRSNLEAHHLLVRKLKRLLRKAGYPIILSRAFDRRTPSHQCGTARMGTNPATSVVNGFGRSHDHSNLFVVDASVLPTSGAVNPALTIAALALRTASHIKSKDWV